MENPFQVLENRLQNLERTITELKELLKSQNPENNELLKPKEAADMLGISLTTLWRYGQQGKVKVYGIGSRRLLKKEEILECLTEKTPQV